MDIVARPITLIFGHSFIRRLKDDLKKGFDTRAQYDFKLKDRTCVKFFGIGGRTVDRSFEHNDIDVVESFKPDLLILEMGTNDLTLLTPNVVCYKLVDLIHSLLSLPTLKFVVWCAVIPRGRHFKNAHKFNASALALNDLMTEALAPLPNVLLWRHHRFSSDDKLFLEDGVHVSSKGQYALYRSYRGAILAGLKHS